MTAVTLFYSYEGSLHMWTYSGCMSAYNTYTRSSQAKKNLSMDCEVAHELSSPSWKLLICDGFWGLESTFSSVMQSLPREPTLAPADGLTSSAGSFWWDLWVQKEAHEFEWEKWLGGMRRKSWMNGNGGWIWPNICIFLWNSHTIKSKNIKKSDSVQGGIFVETNQER